MNAYAQLLSVGLVWITFHCAGMCGPLVIGFDVAGVGRGLPAWRGALRILVYQLGRMTTLMTLGALSGLAGKGLAQAFAPAGAVMSLAFSAVVVAALVMKLVALHRAKHAPIRVRTRLEGAPPPRRWSFGALLRPLSLNGSVGGTWLLGALMGFLPCMIVVWALGLAATTASVFDGAAVMALLVAMTTPMLLGVTLLPRALPARALRWAPQVLMGISAVWLAAVGLAGLEVVPHVHMNVGELTIMLW